LTESAENLRIVFAGGGTGGHLYPALNIAEGIKKRWKSEFLFFGTNRGIESTKVPEYGYPLIKIPVAGFHRRITLKNLSFLFKLMASLHKCKKELKRFRPHLVIGTGGYVMGPVLRTAGKLEIPIIIQEQNSFPGLTTRILAKHAEVIFLGYENAREYLPDAQKLIVTGNPINTRPVTISKEEGRKKFGLAENLKTLLVFGGSQGSRSINESIERILLKKALPKGVQLFWQTGVLHYAYYKQFIGTNKIKNVVLQPFINEMYKAYHAADLAICRAGAMTLTELMYAGLVPILVPLPSAAGNHQAKNAEALQGQNAAIIVEENKDMDENIVQVINEFIFDDGKLNEMAKRLNALARYDTMEVIINCIGDIIKEKYNQPFVTVN
jgi:UDP-N-acetylglucosamine--N-acetylmuramyl-(pentapeptide) pyrophosphoryl-undecaprenol N-acetylglucosamine transferase